MKKILTVDYMNEVVVLLTEIKAKVLERSRKKGRTNSFNHARSGQTSDS